MVLNLVAPVPDHCIVVTFTSKSEPYCSKTVLSHANTNKNIKLSSFKSSQNIQKKEGGLDNTVSKYQFSSLTLNELAMNTKERESIL